MMKLIKLCVFLITILSGCVPRKDIAYFQNIEALAASTENEHTEITIQPKDLLSIVVTSSNVEAARPFNLLVESRIPISSAPGSTLQGNFEQQPYLVSQDGKIDFPIIGKVDVLGLTIDELNTTLIKKLKTYLKDAVVTTRLINFQVSILGEVLRPGTYQINNEKLSLPAALGLAGDLTIYGKRDNILIIREQNGAKNYKFVDITDANLIASEYYYIKQNDIIYVEPNSAQRQSSNFNRNSTVYVSVASLLVSVLVLLFR